MTAEILIDYLIHILISTLYSHLFTGSLLHLGSSLKISLLLTEHCTGQALAYVPDLLHTLSSACSIRSNRLKLLPVQHTHLKTAKIC